AFKSKSGNTEQAVVESKQQLAQPKLAESLKHRQRAITSFKSIPPEQKTLCYEHKVARRALVAQARCGLELKRASPLQLTVAMIEDGVLEALEGKAAQCKQWGMETEAILDQLTATVDGKSKGENISLHNICY
ncbi:unnamed protein product, partial [Effrenium voratum]